MPIIPLISFTDSNSGRTWTVTYDDVVKVIDAQPDAPTTDNETNEADLGIPAGTVLYHYCDGFDHVKLRSDTIFPFATAERQINSIACGFLGTTASLTTISNTGSPGSIRTMAFEVGPYIPVGAKYYLEVYSHQVSYTAIAGDTATTVVANLIARINATTAAEWDDHDSAPNPGTPGFKPLASLVGGNFSRFKVILNWGNQFAAGVTGGQQNFDFNISVTTTDETLASAHDGTATVITTGTPGITYLYSLDGLTYQSSNIFSDLIPGVYIAYVKGTMGNVNIVKTENFIILASITLNPDLIDFPWQDKICYFFKITRTVDSVPSVFYIAEPVKWDAVNIVAKRDKDWHGWSYQYSDGVIELEFDCPAGLDVIVAEYKEKGNDGELDFTYGYIYQGTEITLFPGKLNFNVYKRLAQKVTASVERKDFNNLFQTRFETKVSMIGTETIDGEPVAAPPVIDLTLHSKEIVRTFSYQNHAGVVPQTVGSLGGTPRYISFDTSAAQQNEIEESFLYPLGISTLTPYDNEKYNWVAKFAGTYNFRFTFTMEFILKAFSFNSSFFTIRAYFRINDTETMIGPELTGFLGLGSQQTVQLTRSADFLNKTLAVGDKVYFYIVASGVAQSMTINQTALSIVADSLESTGSSAGLGWFLFDTIDHIVKTITNNESYLKSNFLSLRGAQQPSDGPGSLFITTNGKQIRRFEAAKSPLQISAKSVLSSAKAIWCLGMGYEKSGDREVVRVERVNYFYQNHEILVIEECYDYKEEVAKDLLYNEIEIGYEKYQAEGYNVLDEFNTKHELITPIKTNKLKLPIKSTLITSGYAIETSRRQQYEKSAKDSVTNDDEGFLIAMRRVDEVTFATERNEAFDVVDNLISPETAYNLRLSPKRMLINWAIWLKNIFFFKAGTEKIKTTQVIHNGELETRLKPTDVQAVGDFNKDLWKENQDIDLGNYPVEENLFQPEWVSWKCRLTPDKIEMINRAMKGQYSKDKNYGYVVVKDFKGDYQGVWLYELAYNFATEKAEFKGLKTWNSPVVPGANCCKYLSVNGCHILVNGNKIIL